MVEDVKEFFARFEGREDVLPVPRPWHLVVMTEARDPDCHGVEQPGLQVLSSRATFDSKDRIFRSEAERQLKLDIARWGVHERWIGWLRRAHYASSTRTMA
jgi:hypothetical protein